MEIPKETQKLIDRLCRAAYCWELDKEKAEKAIRELYEFHKLKVPKIKWVVDIMDKGFSEASSASWASSSSRASQASSASSASWTSWALRALRASWVSWASSASSASSASWALRASRASRASWVSWAPQASQVSSASWDCDFELFIFSHEWLQKNEGNENDKKFLKAMELHLKIKEAGCGYGAEKDGVLYACPNPILRFNEKYEYNSHHLPAIEWKGGAKFYFLNGVNFPFDLWQRVVSREMEMKDIIAIEDIDQRVQAMKFAKNGLRDFYKEQNGKCIDTYTKETLDGEKINYELWEIPEGEVFNQTVHFSIYDCPSAIKRGEKREYTKGTPTELKSIADSMGWGMFLSGEEWKRLIPLVHES